MSILESDLPPMAVVVRERAQAGLALLLKVLLLSSSRHG